MKGLGCRASGLVRASSGLGLGAAWGLGSGLTGLGWV